MTIPEDQIWIVTVGFIIAFILSFGIGANDVANSFGTSVGSKVLTLRQACILATIFELLGAVLLGGKVSETIRSKMIEVPMFKNQANGVDLLLYGQISSLLGSCIWLLVATFFRVPVSGTHSIVGATIGFALVVFGFNGVKWMEVLWIVLSWFASPVLSGILSVIFFTLLRYFVLNKDNALEPALRTLPLIYGVSIIVNVISLLLMAPPCKFERIPIWGKILISIISGIIVAILVKFVLIPRLRMRILRELNSNASNPECDGPRKETTWQRFLKRFGYKPKPTLTIPVKNISIDNNNQGMGHFVNNSASSKNDNISYNSDLDARPYKENIIETFNKEKIDTKILRAITINTEKGEAEEDKTVSSSRNLDEKVEVYIPTIKDRPEEAKVFSYVQILTAIFGSFAHGGNDVSNAIGPLVGLWLIATTQQVDYSADTPIYILLYGGLGIVAGLWAWGRRVIETLGEELTTITPTSGVCIELGSALTVLVGSNVGLPISTTHCKVGSVVFVGRFRSKENVNWSIMRNIVIAWVVTLPASGGISALVMFGLMQIVK